MQNAMIGFSPESNWVTSKLPFVGGGNVSTGAGEVEEVRIPSPRTPVDTLLPLTSGSSLAVQFWNYVDLSAVIDIGRKLPDVVIKFGKFLSLQPTLSATMPPPDATERYLVDRNKEQWL